MASNRSYHRLSAQAKRAFARDWAREPAVTCPACEAQTTPGDLPAHLEARCPGPREPHPKSRWIPWREARSLGVPKPTLSRWVGSGRVRVRGEPGEREYLLRDIARGWFRKRNRTPIGLTSGESHDPSGRMKGEPLDDRTIQRLQDLANRAGGVEPLSRRIDVPTPTLRRAIAGAGVRKGTRMLIQAGIRKG